MNWEEYEEITKYIYENLGRKQGITIVGYGNNCKVKGKSGVEHQIDVLTSHSNGIDDYQTAIECKYWEKKINKEVVMKMACIIEDANIDKGIVVSKKGYTKDGKAFAEYKDIGLVVLNELEESDQKKEQRNPSFKILEGVINNKVTVRRPEILNIKIDGSDLDLKTGRINPYQMIVKLKNDIELPLNNYVTSFQNEIHKAEPNEIIRKYYELRGARLINNVTKEVTRIEGLTFTGKLIILNRDSKLEIEVVDQVWMIMKSMFENDSFTISKMGMIKKNET